MIMRINAAQTEEGTQIKHGGMNADHADEHRSHRGGNANYVDERRSNRGENADQTRRHEHRSCR